MLLLAGRVQAIVKGFTDSPLVWLFVVLAWHTAPTPRSVRGSRTVLAKPLSVEPVQSALDQQRGSNASVEYLMYLYTYYTIFSKCVSSATKPLLSPFLKKGVLHGS